MENRRCPHVACRPERDRFVGPGHLRNLFGGPAGGDLQIQSRRVYLAGDTPAEIAARLTEDVTEAVDRQVVGCGVADNWGDPVAVRLRQVRPSPLPSTATIPPSPPVSDTPHATDVPTAPVVPTPVVPTAVVPTFSPDRRPRSD